MISSGATQNMQTKFDTGPLSWVMAETREALMNAKRALRDAVEQSAESQSTLLKHAKIYLHQAHGALQMVDVDGVALLSENIEILLDRMADGELAITPVTSGAIEQALDAIQEYLDELLVNGVQQPVRLYPCYRNLLAIKGIDRVSPTDLFFPSLSANTTLTLLSSSGAAVDQKPKKASYANIRQRFEKALLPFLKQSDPQLLSTSAKQMQGLIAEVWHAQTNSQARSFWAVMHGFAELVAEHQVFHEQNVKQLFGRINLQIRRLHEGALSIPESLLRDALFFIARGRNLPPNADNVRRAYELDGQVPSNFETQSFGSIEPGALSISKERLTQIKNLWSKIANGEHGLFEKFEQKMKDLAEVGLKLRSPPLSKLLRELTGLTRHVLQGKPSDAFALEMATSLLFIESALDQITHLPSDFAERADILAARLLSLVSGESPDQSAPWLDDMSRQAQQRQTMAALVGEMQSSLRIVEKTLDEYFRSPTEVNDLVQIDPIMHQIAGALAILDQDEANLALSHTQELIREMAGSEQPTDPAIHAKVAQNIGALSFLIEALQTQPETAKNKFSFDKETGIFKSHFLDKPAAPEAAPADELQSHSPAAEIKPVSTEQELADQQKQSANLASSLVEQPHNAAIQAQLLASLEQERSVARLLDDPNASERASQAIEALTQTDFKVAEPQMNNIISAVVAEPAVAATPALPTHAPMPVGDDAIDAELLEVFLMEAEEVLASVNETIPLSKADPSNQDHLITLRRSFHTLKGSSRMVGLGAFGNAAWSVEQVMNGWLSDARHGTDDLYALLEKASEVLTAWVADFNAMGTSDITGKALIDAADRLKNGGAYSYDAQLEHPPTPVHSAPTQAIAEVAIETPAANEPTHAESSVAVDSASVEAHAETLAATPAELPVTPPQAETESTPTAADHAATAEDVLAAYAAVDVVVPSTPAASADHGAEAEHDLHAPEINFAQELTESSNVLHFPESHAVVEPVEELANEVTESLLPDIDFGSPAEAIEAVEPAPELIPELVHIESEEIAVAPTAEQDVIELTELEIEPTEVVEEEATAVQAEAIEDAPSAPAAPVQEAQIIEFPSSFTTYEDNVKKIGNIEIGVPLYNIYLAETDEIVRFLSQDFSEWRHEAHRPVTTHSVHAAHSLAGSSATVGFTALQEVAHALEMVLQRVERYPVTLLPGEFDTLDNCVGCVKEMLHRFALAEMPPHKPEQILVLEQLLGMLTDRAQPPEIDAAALDKAKDEFNGLFNETEEDQLVLASALPVIEEPLVAAPEIIAAEPVVAEPLIVEPAVIEPEIVVQAAAPSVEVAPILSLDETRLTDVAALPKDDLDADLLPVFLEEGSDLFPQIGQTLRAWQDAPNDQEHVQALLRLLHTVKGSARMAGAMALGQHTHDMESQIEHLMHAGAPSAAALDHLLAHHDVASTMFEQLRNPQAVVAPSVQADDAAAINDELLPSTSDSPARTGLVELAQLVPLNAPSTGAASANLPANKAAAPLANALTNQALVRVRADILDRLVNQAGEVSISRSRLENEVTTLRSSLQELTENVGRLRDQLREVEIQAETQISSRMALSGEREFDPLEFDRFTRLQELTRMMAESVNDVSTVQTNISKTVEGATNDLVSQARLTRELQQDLMRVRMVPFASISERLYRITRQASKELDKRVNLDIRGTSVEIDRSVLERMAGPFEHLLRNAIVHGIESRQQRQELGKNEIGEILVQIRQEGNEVVINFNDDGRGLDLNRIREKARDSGLLAIGDEVTDSEAVNLIFESGFSTASEVTELAGRGVGMDVVRSEATALGGRVSVDSTPNVGSKFTIHLPLTLAVTQVVLVRSGGKIFAVPSVLVEQVQQLKAQMLAAAYNDGAIMWQGQRVAMHYLSTVLGDYTALPDAQQYTPIIVMRSGNDRVALHVDQVIGNREVVVKNIGPQLARMVGISGATVLGSGDIVLILNPLPLAQKMEHDMLRAPRLLQENSETPQVTAADEALGAVAENAPTTQQPVQGLRRHHIVMVVDDSLTVRKVSQRLLVREGYQVILAKDGVDALQQLQAVKPDVMLVDIEMPRMDGFDLTRNVRNDERLKDVPIIMITSRTADKHRNYAQELGVNAYFGKPFQEDVLLEAISSYLPQLNSVE